MSTTTAIEWTEITWNPVTGCDRVSPGCDHCYALTLAKRLKAMGNPKYQRDGDTSTSGPGFGVSMHPDTLSQPLEWRAPRTVFVNSMSDLFHNQVPDEYIEQVFAVMALACQHTFQVLTKRHGRMRSLLSSDWFEENVKERYADNHTGNWSFTWPLPNVWLGVSTENQRWANIRIPALLNTPAAVRCVDCTTGPARFPVSLPDQSMVMEVSCRKGYGTSHSWMCRGLGGWFTAGERSRHGSCRTRPGLR